MGEVNNANSRPEWINKDYILEKLRSSKKNEHLRLLAFSVEPAVGKGENYVSDIFRIKVEFEMSSLRSEERWVLKSPLVVDPFMARIFTEYQTSQTELRVYDEVLPKLKALLATIGDEEKLCAETVFIDWHNEAMILEDLVAQNFVMADRLEGLDEAHTELVLRKLAKFHAAAAVLNERTSGSLEKFQRGMFNQHTSGLRPYFENLFEVCGKFAGECTDLGVYYEKKMMHLKNYCMELATCCYDKQAEHFHTLIHGDLWTNNIMFRYATTTGQRSKKVPDDAVMLDFQFSNWTSPAIDLHYFFNTSLKNQIRLHSQDALIKYYHGILTQTLKALNYTGYVPSLFKFHLQVEAARFIAVASSFVNQAVMINDNTQDADFKALLADSETAKKFRKMLYENEKVQENAKLLLPLFDRLGLLEVDQKL